MSPALCANCNRPILYGRRGTWYCSMVCEVEAEYENEMMQIALALKHYPKPGLTEAPHAPELVQIRRHA